VKASSICGPGVQSWYGNIAKMRIIDEIVSSPGDKVVLDFGAGTGGGWADTLQHHPEIKLYCYEPSRSAVTLAERVPSANIISQEKLNDGSLNVDYIVSFSVLEHVYDRRAYLEAVHKHLAKSGKLFLNYDDGHFRKALDLNAPAHWADNLREHLTNTWANVWPNLGMIGK
jgi:cyclopropane fatty-acyl-phospholipid synthase-like methyltransferase